MRQNGDGSMLTGCACAVENKTRALQSSVTMMYKQQKETSHLHRPELNLSSLSDQSSVVIVWSLGRGFSGERPPKNCHQEVAALCCSIWKNLCCTGHKPPMIDAGFIGINSKSHEGKMLSHEDSQSNDK